MTPQVMRSVVCDPLTRACILETYGSGNALSRDWFLDILREAAGSGITLDPERIHAIMESTKVEVAKIEEMGKAAIVVCSPIVRMYFKKLSEDFFDDLIVVSYNEVENNVELQSVGMVTG